MENLIHYVLGVLSVLAITGVYNMFKTKSQVKDLYEEIEDLQDIINDIETEAGNVEDQLDRRIDQEIDRTDKQIEDLYKYVDSRTDKMESRTDSKFNDNTAFVDLMRHAIEKLQYQLAELKVEFDKQINNK